MKSKKMLEKLENEYPREDFKLGSQYDIEFAIIEKELGILEIIKKHKLLNYVIKNPKCAKMYHLTEDEIEKLKEFMEVKA